MKGTVKLGVEPLKPRYAPANAILVGGVDVNWETAGNWRTYDPYYLTVGGPLGRVPNTGDKAYLAGSSTTDCTIYAGRSVAVGAIAVTGTYDHDLRVAGSLYVHGYNVTAESLIDDNIIVRPFGAIQFTGGTVWMWGGGFRADAAQGDTSGGSVYVSHGATVMVSTTVTRQNQWITTDADVRVGDYQSAVLAAPGAPDTGTVNIRDVNVKFNLGAQLTISGGGTATVKADADFVPTIQGDNPLDGITNYGLFEVLPGSEEYKVDMIMRNNSGVFRMLDESKITLMKFDSTWNSMFATIYGGVVALGNNARLRLGFFGQGEMLVKDSTLEIYNSGSWLSINPEIDADVRCVDSWILPGPASNFGRLTAHHFILQNTTFYTNADSGDTTQSFTLYAEDADILLIDTVHVIIDFTGDGSAMVAGSEWLIFNAPNGKVNRLVSANGTVSGNIPLTLDLLDYLHDSVPGDADQEQLWVFLEDAF